MTGIEALKEQTKKLELVLTDINRQFGKNSIMRYGADNISDWPSITTGALTLDDALGIGGLPKGRVVEIYGPESSGKTTISLAVLAEAQKRGGVCAFIDTEHSLDPQYASILGVNMDDLLLSQPDYGEMALDILIKLVKSGVVSVVVVDSVAALTPKAEIEGDIGDTQVALIPRLMSKAMRVLQGAARDTETLVIFTNQLREKVGIMFGNPEITPGGRALRFAASVRIDMRKMEDIKSKNGSVDGVKIKAKVVKNKMAPPFKIAEFDIIYGHGVDYLGCIIDLCETRDVLNKKAGGWYSYEGESLAQGRDNLIKHLASDLEFAEKLRSLALEP